jgi:hypothetical protein
VDAKREITGRNILTSVSRIGDATTKTWNAKSSPEQDNNNRGIAAAGHHHQ